MSVVLDIRERINLDAYAVPCISDHYVSALPGSFLSSERAALPRCVIGKFPRDSFVQ